MGNTLRRLVPAFLFFYFLALPVFLEAFDFGVILDQGLSVSGREGSDFNFDSDFDHNASIIPRFSALLGDNAELYLSANFGFTRRGSEWVFTPEFLRNELSWRSGFNDFSVGRMFYNDPLNIAVAGLFDGLRFSRRTRHGIFGAGIWYTGFLYKNRANIAMTPEDIACLNIDVDFNDLFGTYFASRRLMAALTWEHPAIGEWLRLEAALLGQADLNNRYRAYHNQYLMFKASAQFGRFIFELGGAVEAAQAVLGNETELQFAFAGDLGLHWMIPSRFHSMLSLTGRLTSGYEEGRPVSAFIPIVAMPYGSVLEAEIPGLSVFSLNYLIRLYRAFAVILNASHFVRSDLGTFSAYPLNEDDSGAYFLGTEFFGRFIWSPFSDVSFNLGGGVFLPSLGNAAPGASMRWRVDMNVILSLF